MIPNLRLLFTGCLMLLFNIAGAQTPQYAYRISFRDKKGAPELTEASQWLSARSLARRANFSITLDSTDRPVSPLYMDSVLSISGGKLHNCSRWLNQGVILVPDSTSMPMLRAKSWVKEVAWVGYFSNGLHQLKPDSGITKSEQAKEANGIFSNAKQSGSLAYYGASFPQTLLVHGDTLHDQGYRGKGKIIALLDAGFLDADIQSGFDSMRAQGRLLETYNFVRDTSFVYEDDVHGSYCLSTIAGLKPGNYVGTAPDASFALYLTDDVNFTDALYELDNLVAGMERADSLGADIISASLAYNIFTSPYYYSFDKSALDGHSTMISHAVNMATAKGMLYVSSAGNEGGNSWDYLTAPGDADSALTVGAVTPSGAAAGFSSPGPNALGHVKPEVCLQGAPAAVLMGSNSTGNSSGTSFSAPQAAGYAACLMQEFPTLPPAFFRETIAQIASLYPSATAKLGYGIPDFRKAQNLLSRYIPDTSGRSMQVFPNPFETYINLSPVNPDMQLEVRLFDAMGRQLGISINRKGAFAIIEPLTQTAKGVYFLEIFRNGQRTITKLMRQ